MGPIPCKSSFSLVGVMSSGNEPITTRFDGFPLLDALVTTTRLDLESGVALEGLVLLSEGPTTIRLEELFSECLDSLPSRLCDARSRLRLLRWPSLDLSFSLVLSLSLSLGLSRSGRSRSRSLSRGLSWRVSRDSRCSRRSRSLSRGFSRSLLSRFL